MRGAISLRICSVIIHALMDNTIKQIKKELGIGNRDIADAFGYKNRAAYDMSSAKPRIEKGIEWLYDRIQTMVN